jgi:hypothetical protein
MSILPKNLKKIIFFTKVKLRRLHHLTILMAARSDNRETTLITVLR